MALGEARTVTQGTTVAEACRQAAEEGVVLVTDANGLLSGILTHTDISIRVIAEGLQVEQTLVSKIMTRNPSFVPRKTLIIEALQKMVQGKYRHLPVVENGEAICMMMMSYCIRYVVFAHDHAAKNGSALGAPIGVERQSGSNFLDAYKIIEILSEHICKPLSTIISENSKIPTVAPSDTVHVATRKMRDLCVNYVVITVGNSLRGILTSKDVLTRVIGHNRPPELTQVEKVMTLHPNCATLDATILDALRLMDSGKFLHVPVLDGDGMLITCLDVLQLLKLRDPALDFDPQDEDHSLSYASIDRLDIKCMTPSVLELIMLEGSSKPTNLPFTLLQVITNNFSDERTIGYGGFGIVFKVE